MMKSIAGFALAGAAVLFATTAQANESKSWYVYCEGESQNTHWAVFSKNIWPHPETESYGRRLGSAAQQHFERTHNVALTGCSGVKFFDASLAEYSRERTVRLHKQMGDQVYFFQLPTNLVGQQ
ncbi:MAG: hypothetical protein AAFV19_10890 [Pseudomonadota bacterium]